MRQKISKLAKELNVSVSTAAEFLRKNGFEVEDNLNARIDEPAVTLLQKEFKKDASVKATVELQREEKRAAAAKDRAAEIAAAEAEEARRKAEAEKAEAERKAREEAEEAARREALERARREEEIRLKKEAEAKARAEAEAKAKAEAEAEAKARADRKAKAEKEAEERKNREAEKAGAAKKQTQDADNKANSAQEAKPAKEADAAPAVTGPQLKIVGKIDLSALNQNTRPKKKSKEERRRERIDKSRAEKGGAAGGNGNNADRRKRTRIGKEKIDVEKAGQQVANDRRNKNDRDKGGDNNRRNQNGAGGRNRDNQGAGRNRGDRGGNNRQNEVRSEDVQKQVKETLARLTNKTTKKSVKWRKEKREEAHNRELANQQREAAESRIIKITEFVTANDLANLMEIPVNSIIATCMNLGVMVSINQRLDAETINIVAEEFGFTTEYVSAEVSEAIATEEDKEEDLVERPPIVTVMGHVDHGKTSLLDFIRNSNVIAGEAGGITQHIGAYNVKLPDGRHITFLDTPGHEAFTAMRARGAKVTDLAIIIVAADDNVMPQTIEAINHASAAGVPMVFAINKIDKPAANPDNIKQELANMNYLVEEWGGKYQSQDISAKKGIGVEELMEKVLLEAELLELKANPNRLAVGSVIESSLDKGRGYVATVLVQNGTLRVGDVVLAGTHYGKVKAMFNERNQRIKEAGPAVPVLILGLNGAPTAGDTFNVLETEQEAREIAGKREQLQRELSLRTKKRPGLEELGRRRALNDFHELNLVVKGDVDGSIEALSDSLIKLSTPEIQVNVLHKGVGAISESDVTLAAASDAIIIGFQVRPSAAARREADKEGVEIRLYSVIYKAIEEVKDAMEGLLSPEIKEEITGNAEVLQTYHISKVGTIAGAIVRDGKIKRQSKVRVVRDGIVIYTGELGSLKRFKDDVKEVVSGYDCGLSVQGYNDIREGDIIEAFEEVEVKKTL
ncbi:MAG: translation initiation factor IF-2 [Muribaculaceae bacterium]|nr:translation initiation factor IF-2 [Muribaculaceae bacterium]